MSSSDKNISEQKKYSNAQYTKNIESLGALQNNEYQNTISGFKSLVEEDHAFDLADNAQYWLAGYYYSQKDYKRAIIEV